jgi:hypothetical protein
MSPVGGRVVNVGDVVRIGKGKVLWTIEEFDEFLGSGVAYAVLRAVDGYATGSATLDRLTVVTKAAS